MLVVTKLNNGSFGRIKRHKYAFLVEGFGNTQDNKAQRDVIKMGKAGSGSLALQK